MPKIEIPNLPEVPSYVIEDREVAEYLEKLREIIELLLGRTEGLLGQALISVQGKQTTKDIATDYNITTDDLGKSLRSFGPNDLTWSLPALTTDHDGYRLTVIKGHVGDLQLMAPDNYSIGASSTHIINTTANQDETVTLEYHHGLKKYQVISDFGTWTNI